MSEYKHSLTYPLAALAFALLVSLVLLAACDTGADFLKQTAPTIETATVTDVVVILPPSPVPSSKVDPTSIDQLIASFIAAGAAVINNGLTQQGLFPGHDIKLWHLIIDGRKFDHDVLIRLDGTIQKLKKKLSKKFCGISHKISEAEAEFIYEAGGQTWIVGSGQYD